MMRSGTGYLLYEIMDEVMDDYFPLLNAMDEHIDDFEERLFDAEDDKAFSGSNTLSTEIFALKRDLIQIRRIAGPTRDVVNILLRRDADTGGRNFAYYQDLYDHAARIVDQIDSFREMLTGALDAYLATESNRMNKVMKTLTACSIILLVPNLIAAIYGMNFNDMPIAHGFWGSLDGDGDDDNRARRILQTLELVVKARKRTASTCSGKFYANHHQRPNLLRLKTSFHPQNARDFIEGASEERIYEKAAISTVGKAPMLRPEIRNNDRVIWDDNALAQNLWQRMAGVVPDPLENRRVVGLNERFRFYRYDVGQTFRPHYDGAFTRANGEISQVTLMIYLNDNFRGGQTNFDLCYPHDEKNRAAARHGAAFLHHLRHEGAQVLAGLKYVLRIAAM